MFIFRGISRSQHFIRRYTVQLTQCNKVAERHFVGTALISGIHGLGCAQIFSHFSLRHVVVFTKVSQFLHNLLHIVHRLSALQCTKVKIFTIDFSKHLY